MNPRFRCHSCLPGKHLKRSQVKAVAQTKPFRRAMAGTNSPEKNFGFWDSAEVFQPAGDS